MFIVNTEQHIHTALVVEPFGDDGAMRFVPIHGERSGVPFILDASAVRELYATLDRNAR